MAHFQQHSHVPKFGNWDTDNVPYTAYFENARREKAGFMMNPNDPMENPEAFNMCMRVGENVDADEVKASHTYPHKKGSHLHHRSRGSFTSEFASQRNHVDHSVINSQSDQKRSMSKGASTISNFSSSSHNRHRSGSHSLNDHQNHQPIPKFGSWDAKDPRSGEGYTAIFSKIKEERQIASSHISTMSTQPLNNCSNNKNQYTGPSFSYIKKKDGAENIRNEIQLMEMMK
ncbi:RIN4, pathogenic type III effector avirulence factor Avr cleavage site [Sesbania bispinosa]|nr:RIN4, pathogenic type III effector avirulence factor Avr cleavage site [Sesbania bispinosa]